MNAMVKILADKVLTRSTTIIAVVALFAIVVTCNSPQSNTGQVDTELDSLLKDAIQKTNQLKFEEARAGLEHVVQRSKERQAHKYEVLGAINYGILYLKYNAFEEALRYFLQANELAEAYHQDDLLNTIYNDIGIVYSINNAHDKAIEYYEKALAISRTQENQTRSAMNLLNLGIEIRKKGDEQKGLIYLRESQKIFVENKDTVNTAAVLFETGEIHSQLKQYDSALIKYRQAHRLGMAGHDQYFHPQFSLGLAQVYSTIHRYDSAALFARTSLEGFRKTRNTEYIISSYDLLSKVSEAKGEIKDAMEYSKLSLAWKDSLLQEKTTRWISELQMKYEFGKKEKEIELMKAQSERERQFMFGIIAVGVIIAGLVFYTLRTKNINLAQKNIILQKQQEVNALTLEKNESIRQQLEKDIEAKEKLNEVERQRLLQEIMYKDRELAAKALHLVNKNEVFTSIHAALSELDLRDPNGKSQVDKIKKMVQNNEHLDNEWETFKLHFEEVHPGFFNYLSTTFPSLSPNDLRLSAYLLIDLNSKEIANIYNISPESVRKKKQRLREKFNLEKDEDIRTMLNRFRP